MDIKRSRPRNSGSAAATSSAPASPANYKKALRHAQRLSRALGANGVHLATDVLVMHQDGAVLYARGARFERHGAFVVVVADHHGPYVFFHEDLLVCRTLGPRNKPLLAKQMRVAYSKASDKYRGSPW